MAIGSSATVRSAKMRALKGPEYTSPMTSSDSALHRPIRSFVLRQGRITEAQRQALDLLWPRYGIEPADCRAPALLFPQPQPLVLEIGFGNGESLTQMAAATPERNFLGIEVHRPGVGHALLRVEELGLKNLRVCCADAVEVLKHFIPDASLAGIQVFFPDPWHKKRHHKRRLINPEFTALAARKLQTGGVLHAATDWHDYALQMLEVLEGCEPLKNQAGAGQFSERPAHRPLTKFESRGQRLGHGVWDLLFEKRP